MLLWPAKATTIQNTIKRVKKFKNSDILDTNKTNSNVWIRNMDAQKNRSKLT